MWWKRDIDDLRWERIVDAEDRAGGRDRCEQGVPVEGTESCKKKGANASKSERVGEGPSLRFVSHPTLNNG